MNLIEPIEIVLDKPRKLLINHLTLFKAEGEINRMRFAKPEDYAAIDVLMIDSFNHLYRARGMLPLDLLLCLICHGLVYDDPKEKRLTIEQVAALLDKSETSRAELSGVIWGAYYRVASKNLKQVEADAPPTDEKKTEDQPTGSDSGASGALN